MLMLLSNESRHSNDLKLEPLQMKGKVENLYSYECKQIEERKRATYNKMTEEVV